MPAKTARLEPVKKRQTHKAKMAKISLNISSGLLDKVDEAADKDFTNRSEIIRTALLWYLRPQGRDLAEVDPDSILEILKRRHALAEMNKLMAEFDA